MTEESDRNPSPPKELLESSDDLVPDKIGESVFSKHWVFQCLIHVIQAVEKEDEKPEPSGEKEQNETDNSGEEEGDKAEVLELNKELEEELCTLWDMSANNCLYASGKHGLTQVAVSEALHCCSFHQFIPKLCCELVTIV
ncbi:protein saal1-like [Limulus polyphemus]|uniref:Protein saal1-like n=1 Tax=Limulus polyphemus TaxID=6850 RepID=A0ABM1T6S4_LIMPO|nr:protein saal1-like [Limulus polyphemus]